MLLRVRIAQRYLTPYCTNIVRVTWIVSANRWKYLTWFRTFRVILPILCFLWIEKDCRVTTSGTLDDKRLKRREAIEVVADDEEDRVIHPPFDPTCGTTPTPTTLGCGIVVSHLVAPL